MIFAKKDIEEPNLKVKAGHPLPERFQGTIFLKSLRESLGESAVVNVTEGTRDHILVATAEIESLQSDLRKALVENEELKGHLAALRKKIKE